MAGPTAQAPPAIPRSARGCRPHPYPCALPPGGGLPTKMATCNKCPAIYSPLQAPALLGITKAGAVADGAAIAPASPPPTPHGVDFLRDANNKCHAVYSSLQAPLCPTHIGRSR